MTRRPGSAMERNSTPKAQTREWLGARVLAPFTVHDRAEPYRPGLVLWFELPDGFLIGYDVFTPEDAEGAVARALRATMTRPAVGPPRLPDAIRVADAATAAEVRAEVAGNIPVTVAPTPEIDALVHDLFEAMSEFPDEIEPSYMENGRVPAAAVAALFEASRALFEHRPWTLGDEPPDMRMDIPTLDVDGACVFVIGQTDEVRGVLIFPSVDHFDAFVEASEERAYESGELGSEVLSLTFEPAAELPQSMRREAMEHGWRVHGPDAYPLVQRRDSDSMLLPLLERDVLIAAACAEALCAFLDRHASVFGPTDFDPIDESYLGDDGREVRLTAPYEEDFDLSDSEVEDSADYQPLAEDSPFTPRAGRNEPCPCGSGRKYKKCHLPTEEARHAQGRRANAAHRIDAELLDHLAKFALQEFGEPWRRFQESLASESDSTFLTYPLSIFSYEMDGSTVVDAFLDAHGHRWASEERRWLKAQRDAWFSVWEVEAVEPGRTLTLRDLLSGERRSVLERKASEMLTMRDTLLARVVDYDGLSLLAGIHAVPLPPYNAAEVVHRARARLRRKRDVPVERLRDATFGRNLLRYWEDAAEELRMQRAVPPDLRNRDGDALLPTVDRFEVAPGAMAEVEGFIAQLEGAVEEDAEDGTATYAFLRADETLPAGETTVVGWIRLAPTILRIETNSQARADALRNRIEAVCGARIRHRVRDHTNPLPPGTATEGPPSKRPPPSAEDRRYAAEHKARHYAEWPDMPLPALNQKTPRECARTAAGRREVDLLLKHMEHMEQHAPGDAAFDFSIIRDVLGIP